MKRFLSLAFLFCGVCRPLTGQTPDATAATSRPELTPVVASYTAQEDAIDTALKPTLLAARDQYIAALTALAAKLDQSKRADEADKVRAESKRFSEHGLDGEPAKTAPPAIRTAWSTLLHATADANESVALKRSSVRAKFDQELTAIERTYRAKSDAGGLALIRRDRAAVAVRHAEETNGYAVTEVFGRSEGWWQDVPRDGGYLVGFDLGKGGWFQFTVAGLMTPIFETINGPRDGEPRGHATGERVLAKEGYAVGGLIVRGGVVVNTVKIIFMRINPDGVSLDPHDSYVSDWLGGEGGGPVKEINAHGHLVTGVTGTTSDVVDSIGLIYLK